MDLETFRTYCLAKLGATEDFPHGDIAAWYKVGGKMFAMTFIKDFTYEGALHPPFTFVNLKCDPERAVELREQHPAIIPGWHQSKKHWNSVFMDGSLEDQLVLALIDHSYDLVFKSLSKKNQKEIVEGN